MFLEGLAKHDKKLDPAYYYTCNCEISHIIDSAFTSYYTQMHMLQVFFCKGKYFSVLKTWSK